MIVIYVWNLLTGGGLTSFSHLSRYEREGRKNTIACVGVIAFLIGAYFLYLLGGYVLWQARLALDGATVPGILDKAYVIRFRDSQQYGTIYHFDLVASRYYARRISTTSQSLGPIVTIRYLKFDPLQNDIDGGWDEKLQVALQLMLILFHGGIVALAVRQWNLLSAPDKRSRAFDMDSKALEELPNVAEKRPVDTVYSLEDSRLIPLEEVGLNSLTTDRSR